jgi:hypothetical protein
MTLVVAIHGIMTGQTPASWPDKLDAWMLRRDPRIKLLKKEYRAGPFPRWNCWIKDPWLARGLVNELELFLDNASCPADEHWAAVDLASMEVWFVAHSNGAVISLLAAKRLIARGYRIAGVFFTGAACDAELSRNGVLKWLEAGQLGCAIACCSHEDAVLGLGKLIWPYGALGRTGWCLNGEPFAPCRVEDPFFDRIQTRWYPGGHSRYFAPDRMEKTFEQIYQAVAGRRPEREASAAATAQGEGI